MLQGPPPPAAYLPAPVYPNAGGRTMHTLKGAAAGALSGALVGGVAAGGYALAKGGDHIALAYATLGALVGLGAGTVVGTGMGYFRG